MLGKSNFLYIAPILCKEISIFYTLLQLYVKKLYILQHNLTPRNIFTSETPAHNPHTSVVETASLHQESQATDHRLQC